MSIDLTISRKLTFHKLVYNYNWTKILFYPYDYRLFLNQHLLLIRSKNQCKKKLFVEEVEVMPDAEKKKMQCIVLSVEEGGHLIPNFSAVCKS